MPLTELSRDFGITPEMRSWAEIETPIVNIDREHKKFLNYWIAKRKRMHDWRRTWENWMYRAPQMGGVLYTAGEIRLRRLRAEFTSQGFREPRPEENDVMYQVQFDAWDLKRRQVPVRDMSGIAALAASKLMEAK